MIKKLKLIVLLFALFSLNSVYACSNNQAGNDKNQTPPESAGDKKPVYNIGDVIENFTIVTADGTSTSLEEMKDSKAKVLIFWSVQCPVVQAYSDRVVSLSNEYKEKGVDVVLVYSNTTESISDIKEHAASKNYEVKIMVDEGYKVADMFGASKTPEVYMIDENNVLVYKGRVDDSQNESKVSSRDLRNALDEVLAGGKVSMTETKAFGCSIKR